MQSKLGNVDEVKNIAVYIKEGMRPLYNDLTSVVKAFEPPTPEQGVIKNIYYRMYA